VRVAILISLAAFAAAFSDVRADDALTPITLGTLNGYIVPETYAVAYKADLVASLPGYVKVEGFWTPPEQDCLVADRALRELIHAAAKDATVLFPDLAPNPDPTVPVDENNAKELEHERSELSLISDNYATYSRQYLGVIIDGVKYVICNYSDGTKADPAAGYILIQKTYVSETTHFLQCRFEPWQKNITNVSIIGSWQAPAK